MIAVEHKYTLFYFNTGKYCMIAGFIGIILDFQSLLLHGIVFSTR